jgi:hypothetical protein
MAKGQLLRADVNTLGVGANRGQLLYVQATTPVATAKGQLLRVDANVIAGGAAQGQLSRASLSTPTISRTGGDIANVEPGTTVTLVGVDIEISTANRQWVQVSGPKPVNIVQLGKTATFVAPGLVLGDAFAFDYFAAANDPARVTVTIQRSTQFQVVGGVVTPMLIKRATA